MKKEILQLSPFNTWKGATMPFLTPGDFCTSGKWSWWYVLFTIQGLNPTGCKQSLGAIGWGDFLLELPKMHLRKTPCQWHMHPWD